jgi:imidazole glycerol-phosphate synthase subunit HisH
MLKVAVVDYDMGNLHSVCKGLQRVGADPHITDSVTELLAADAVILPGVGAFDPAMQHLHARRLVEPLQKIAISGQPFLGVCLGLQLLFEGSAEGQEAGLGVVPGQVKRFKSEPELTIPHMGWNQLKITQPDCPLWQDLKQTDWVYFVHSFYVEPSNPQITAATVTHGHQQVTAAIALEQLMAVQFHPEKSSTVGLAILANFLQTLAVSIA